uniref:G patch domain-containing protein 4 n=1 Tax=Petromyzon marinus TaxID=7757 RepID=S4RY02_PETMA
CAMETRESGSGRRFAEAQMLKHGWTREAGKGLGRFENGRAEAVKVKVKHDTAGIGHDMAEQFTFHWWDHVFNKAAASIEVEGTEEGAKVMGNRSDGAEEPISNRKPRKAHLSTTHALYGNFVKAATLTSGEEVRDEKESSEVETSSSEDEDAKLDLSSTTRMTDEQLLRACGGRTAHKGARHGVNMSAKLARLAQQEREFLSRWGGGGGSARADHNNEVAEEEVVVVDRSERKKKKKKNKKRARERQDGERRGSPAGETNEPKPERSSEEKSVARSDERSAKTAKKRKHKT